MTVFVLQAYGTDTIINQNIFCLLSLLHQSPREMADQLKIVVYTDQAEKFRQFFGNDRRIQYEDMSPSRVKEWRGAINFVHRVKIEMLRDVARKFPSNNIFYVDGDTVFLKDPSPLLARIDDKNSIMHECENIVEQGRDPISKKLTRFLRKDWSARTTASQPVDDPTRHLNAQMAMWNAGVLGFAPSFHSHLDDVLHLTEELYLLYPKHVMEQLAFSFYLQEYTQVQDAREFVLHYWRQKDAFNEWIGRFLAENVNFNVASQQFDLAQLPPATSPKKRGLGGLFKNWRALRP